MFVLTKTMNIGLSHKYYEDVRINTNDKYTSDYRTIYGHPLYMSCLIEDRKSFVVELEKFQDICIIPSKATAIILDFRFNI